MRFTRWWRPQERVPGTWHCYTRAAGGAFVSLCGFRRRWWLRGAALARPPPLLRCGRCDGREIAISGKAESLPETAKWRLHVPNDGDAAMPAGS